MLHHDPLELCQVLPVLRQLVGLVRVGVVVLARLAVCGAVVGGLAARAEGEAAGGALAEVIPLRDLQRGEN